jgi:hypothetical protein
LVGDEVAAAPGSFTMASHGLVEDGLTLAELANAK